MTTQPQPTWRILLDLVSEAERAVKQAEGGELEKTELRIAARKLKRKLKASVFDVLDPIPSIAQADVRQLESDMAVLKKAIAEDATSGGGWKGILGGIVRSVTRLIPGGELIEGFLPK